MSDLSESLMLLQDVTKTFEDGNRTIYAVDHLDLQIRSGEFIALYGPSGSGKTTLLNLIGGLDRPSSGELSIGEYQLNRMSEAELTDLRLMEIGFIFQSYNLIPVFSALENVAFILQMQGVEKEQALKQSREMLHQVGLQNMENRRPAELSGGQQQRVAVARAIVSKPKIVLADEPTANLDSQNSQELIDLMKHLNQTHKMTFVISSHDPQVIDSARRKIHLKDGKIVSDEIVSD
ncbi:ABC transporter ATP-binding protein [Thiomicrorhabdus heinhorstiae]|uniref:ABC transporter ATP-binding protein n=1 Tax=Thiomicrorhabdus heinhorstiae TaxID=2748010 RepID=A0ABS0BVA1_9GAMM|nr:ABC transporter ATP-binding protein [Thiomicrorhabdus heinhorstiae]MBF6057761.1 ABC transporter ATP-binding protein [Thiomicrorhabdus heinhorstiae]